MSRAFRISFSLKNTYRVNSIIYSIQQIPLIKKILPSSLYKIKGLKIFANILAGIWELITMFLGKYLYLLLMVSTVCGLYDKVAYVDSFSHILFFLTIIGAYMNTYMFNPTNDKYYAMILMRMDAKSYTLSNYGYAILKVFLGFLPFTILFGLNNNVPLWLCILFPFFVIATKLVTAWLILFRYKKTGECTNENLPPKLAWSMIGVLLLVAYGLPYLGITIPIVVVGIASCLIIGVAIFAITQILCFDAYREMYQILLAEKRNNLDFNETVRKTSQEQYRKVISQDINITSDKTGFEYFNELFVKRHQKILWKSSKRLTAICIAAVIFVLLALQFKVELKEMSNQLLMVFLPYFVFIMYIINRGTSFTQVLFMNCDHSLLTYSFYKKPEFILKLFKIRLRELIKINVMPASIIGFGLSLILYWSGGTTTPVHYIILPVSIISMSIFFSVHYLTWYYLLQPYNLNTEMKSSMYTIVSWVTYGVCFAFIQIRMDTLIFGILVTSFCILYCIIACILVYKYAHKTFKLRA